MFVEVPPAPLPLETTVYLKQFLEELLKTAVRSSDIYTSLERAYRMGKVQTEHRLRNDTTLGELEKVKQLASKFISRMVDIRMASSLEEAQRIAKECFDAEPMTIEQINEQRASFAFGQLAMTSKYLYSSPEELLELRAMCRKIAGCKDA